MGGQEARHGCEFGSFFSCEDGATPQRLLQAGIYHTIASPLKGGAWRDVSMAMLAMGLADMCGTEGDGGPGVAAEDGGVNAAAPRFSAASIMSACSSIM